MPKQFIGNTRLDRFPDKNPCVKLSLRGVDLLELIKQLNSEGWVNLELKAGKDKKWYTEISSFVPVKQEIK